MTLPLLIPPALDMLCTVVIQAGPAASCLNAYGRPAARAPGKIRPGSPGAADRAASTIVPIPPWVPLLSARLPLAPANQASEQALAA